VQPSFEPIGVVRSPLRSRKDAPRSARDGAPAAVLELDERFAAALEGVLAGIDLAPSIRQTPRMERHAS
jgi:tRNA (Thr-GGU) A37 N-methylase